MIVELAKYLIVGSKSDMDRFFILAQRAGFIEFIGLSKKKTLEMPEDAKTILSAIKIVRAHSTHSPIPFETQLDPVTLAGWIVKCNEDHEKLLEEERMLTAEITRIQAFGNFSRHELDKLENESKRVFQFFCMKSDLAREMTLPSEVIYVGTEYDLDYFVSINKERKQYPKMIEIIIDKPVGELRERLQQVKLESARVEAAIHESAPGMHYLQNGLLSYLNEYHLKLAKHDAINPMSSLFAIEAWVPKTKIKGLHGLLSNLDVFAEEIAIEERDRMPTCQENKGPAKIGEDLVHVYDIPSWTDKDPSLWILVFFAIFFAMIVSDAGYGLIYLSIGLFLKFKFKKAAGFLRRFIKLILILSTACIIWGVATASFFGIEIGPENPFRKMSFINYLASKKADYHLRMKDDVYEEYLKEFPELASAKDADEFFLATQTTQEGKTIYQAQSDFSNDILLELALFIGVIHISLSFIRYMRRNWTGIGWILFMAGGYLYFPSFLDATSLVNFLGWVPKTIAHAYGSQILYAGLALVLIISLLMKKKWGALHELTNAIQVFADVLSYLRLYALALAGMIMASTFNDLAIKAGIFGGIFIVIIGHLTNLTLTVMSGTIHGLRLNFLEWYHYSFEGGGRLFDPLRIRKSHRS
ncbi:MAG: V-type ATP synthase subunit I [Parachlamydiales bacterium]|nr:V-type ATP synthase subunit I [Parachlamydiales bacterium]